MLSRAQLNKAAAIWYMELISAVTEWHHAIDFS